MKIALILVALSLGISSACAQKLKEADVPAAVKDGFKKSFPVSKVEKWEKEGDKYEAEFDLNKVETSALMDLNGVLLQTETEMPVTDLPKGVTEYLNKYEGGKKIKEAAKITDNKGTVSYEAECGEADYIFDSLGNFLKKEIEKDKDKDDKKEKK